MLRLKTVTINFPAPLPAEIPCPICEGNKCNVCAMKGKIEITVDAKVPIQRNLIVKYVANHLDIVASELSKNYGLVPEVETSEMFEKGGGTYEVVKVSSIGGVMWVVHRVDELESPRYYTSIKKLKAFQEKGLME